jgi:phosphohistidine phosphatase
MKILTLVRHAKSSWKNPDLADHERPLNKRGERDAPEMGRRLAAQGQCPDLIVTSPAVRAKVTAETIAEAVGYRVGDIVEDERIYEANAGKLLDVIRELDDSHRHVMLFGHNPGFTHLVNRLAEDAVDNVPTCGVVQLEHEGGSWSEVGRLGSMTMDFDYPKNQAGAVGKG